MKVKSVTSTICRSKAEKMNKDKNSFVEPSGRNDQAARDNESREFSSESKIIIVALPCEICDELCPSDKLMEHQRNCQKERETARRNTPRASHRTLGEQEFVFSVQDSLPVHRTGYIEVQRGYSSTIEFEDDCSTANESVENDTASDFFVSGERNTVYFSPSGAEPFATRSGSDATYIEIQRSYSPVMEFEEEDTLEVFSHNIAHNIVHTPYSTSSFEHRHQPHHFYHGGN